MEPHIPGYVACAPVPAPPGLSAWRGKRTATGERVRLLHVSCDGGPEQRDRLRERAARLSALEHPHLLSVRDVVSVPDGIVLVHPEPVGQSLAALLDTRGQLTDGELVTLGLPLVAALSASHEAGVRHGWISPDWVLIDDIGRPVLAGLGLRALVETGVDTGTDVSDLGALLRVAGAAAVSGSTLPELGAALRRLGPPRPLSPRETSMPLAPVVPRREASPRRLFARAGPVAGVLLLVCLAVVFGTHWGRDEGSAAVRAAHAQPPWVEVVRALDAARDTAVAAGDPDALEQVYAPGSPALTTERQRLTALLDQELVARGVALSVLGAKAVTTTRDEVVLQVSDAMSAYDVLDAQGRVAAHHDARGERRWQLQLTRVDGSWRIWSVAAVPQP